MSELMILPSGSCNASCGYCFSPGEEVEGLMPLGVLERALGLYAGLVGREGSEPRIVFHGGEPLLAGIGFYREALGAIREAFGSRARVGIQSNLWLLDEAFCELFGEYGVSFGTSLDGPREINDAQRCPGCFDLTMRGIGLLRRKGLSFGCIATMAKPALSRASEVLGFFADEGIDIDLHVALRPRGASGREGLFLTEDESAEALLSMFEEYARERGRVKIRLFDEMLRSVATGTSGLCAFSRCLGGYFAVAPDGELYPCNRFVGSREYSMGNVLALEDLVEAKASPGWARIAAWLDRVDAECADCRFKAICHGGCPYSGLSRGPGPARDADCAAYKKIFTAALDLTSLAVLEEAAGGASGAEAGSRADLLRIQRGQAHPRDLARYAKAIVGSVGLGITEDLGRIAGLLVEEGLAADLARAESSLASLRDSIRSPLPGLNACYLHVTDECELACSFCYMDGRRVGAELPAGRALALIREAGELGFRKVVVTGGEPTSHRGFLDMARALAASRRGGAAPTLSLRTNLARALGEAEIDLMSAAFDEIVVSLDGDRRLHDERRGEGCYDAVLANLGRFPGAARPRLSLAALFDYSSLGGEELAAQREHVLGLRERFGLRGVKFLPTKPLGRAAGIEECPAARGSTPSLDEALERGRRPAASCGLGRSLMIMPDGGAYPCYALAGESERLGDALESGLAEIARGDAFRRLGERTVDSDPSCGACSLRYICERKCLCWKDADCGDFRRRATGLLDEACAVLGLEAAALEALR
jgi:uncharacterized protein